MNRTLLRCILSICAIVTVTQSAHAQLQFDTSEYLARRGEGEVSVYDFEARMSKIPERDQAAVLADVERLKGLLKDLLILDQLVVEARKEGFDQDPVVIARMQAEAKRTLALDWLDHYTKSQPEADYDALALERYLTNKESYKSQKMVDVTHLLISREDRQKEEALLIAEEVLEKVQAEPERFVEFVLEYSEDSTARANNGQFTEVKPGVMVRQFEQAAWALKNPGDFTGLVESPFGFHIIRLDKIHEPRQYEFEEIKGNLVNLARAEHQERVRGEYIESLSELNVDINDPALEYVLRKFAGVLFEDESSDTAELE